MKMSLNFIVFISFYILKYRKTSLSPETFQFRRNKLRHLPSHLLQLCQCRVQSVTAIHPYILLPHLLASFAVRAQFSHAHPYYIFLHIFHFQICLIQIAEQKVRVSSNLVTLVIQTVPIKEVCPGLFKHLNYFGDNVGRVEEVITVRFRYYSCYTVFISVFHLQRLVFIRPRPPLCILCSDNPVPVRSLSPDLLSLRD